MTLALEQINDRWRATGHPHAVPHGQKWKPLCPRCNFADQKEQPSLQAAMNVALAHKGKCPALS